MSQSINVVVVSGSLRDPSRTHVLLQELVNALQKRLPANVHWVRIAELSGGLAGSLERDTASPQLLPHLQAIESADLIIAGSPVYRASYTGLFKHFFDLVDYQSLKGVPVLLAATGGGERHALVIDHQLRPLFAFFQAHTLPYGLYATPETFTDYRLTDAAQFERIERALDPVEAFFRNAAVQAA
ncbi:FMN reductase [Pseudomonas sp. TTU2014-080ASC]|uniref:FMN reductase n=1 Tax=Pseudomonas sp. TTU2014-080ASC TaxID=1729724 RepID=UPI0007186AB8|nr:FMN reductase [Pseudomonas sp. TTU2014-080ASC]KRW62538.1 FMN reductase [Pseudomonas sp. TTU2014-080ASC]